MKTSKRRTKLEKEWQDLKDKTGGTFEISLHCCERILKRFPELLEITENDFIQMVLASKPLYTFGSPTSKKAGIVVRNKRLVFAVSFDTGKIMTIYAYKKKTVKKTSINHKGGPCKKKLVYKRPKAKRNFQKSLVREYSA